MTSDAELLAQYRTERSAAAFAQIVERHGPMVLRTCLHRLGNLQDAEDAAQNSFLVLARQADSIKGSLGGWLHGVAQQTAGHVLRSRLRRTHHEEEASRMKAFVDSAGDVPGDWQEELDRALAELPEPLREAVILRYLEDRKYEEAARLAGCPLATLAYRATQGLNQLRAILGRRGMSFSVATLTTLLGQEAASAASLAEPIASLNAWAAGASANGGPAATAVPLVWARLKLYLLVTAGFALAAGGIGSMFVSWPGQNPVQLGVNGSLGGRRPFPSDSVWNEDIAQKPLDPRSDALIAHLGADWSLTPYFGTFSANGSPRGYAYAVVSGQQARQPVRFTYPDQSDAGPYPIPDELPLTEAEFGNKPLLIVDRDNWTLYELSYAQRDAQGWRGQVGAIFDLNANRERPAGWVSADIAGLPIFPGLVRYDEVFEQKEIRHALRFAGKAGKGYVAPARHALSDRNDPSLPPWGMRVRLKADYNISGFPPETQVILQAMKKYGMFLAGNDGDWYVYGTHDPRWNDANLKSLERLKGRDFEVLQMETIQRME